jgi:hydroxyethylthiazole kinase
MLAKIADVMESVRAKTPLVHCITNYVTINDCANILLCFGASPAMCEAGAEVEEFVSFASALYINIGTFTKEQEDAVFPASLKAAKLNVPVVIDPVACGVISRRMQAAPRNISLGSHLTDNLTRRYLLAFSHCGPGKSTVKCKESLSMLN